MNTISGSRFRFHLMLEGIALILMMNFSAAGQKQFDQLTRVLESKRQALGGNVCMLIFKDNHVVFEKNRGSYTHDTPEMIASCSKWLTAALVATFIDEGKISPDDTVGKYLPVFSRYGKGNITVSQCMSHTSGIESGQITLRSLMERRKIESLDEEINLFAKKPMSGKPGEVFSYGNIGLNIMGRILEVVTHEDFETLFQERIAKPLAMNNTTFTKGKALNPSGGATSTASDYMNFLQMILQKGEFKGKQIIRPKTIELMQLSRTVHSKVVYTPDEAKGFEYGWGEWILEKDKMGNSTVVSSHGLFGTYPWIDLQRNYAAIVFVKNIHVKDRQKNYQQIRDAVNEAVK
ncbi:MAG: serine hydrolase [Bacteroidia bacterium]|nr:serine hydrolase [Bacteroidia bacterium]